MEANFGTIIGIAIMAFGIILAVGKYQYEHDLKHR
jgi:hypothetical protein